MKFLRNVIRTCIGCRGKFPQKTLIRFVCQGDKTLQIDAQKKSGGRGAYVCWSQPCIQKAFKSPKRVNALLRAELTSNVIARFEQVLLEYTRKSTNSIGKRRNYHG
ncbi:MAG: YlxR family protein [Candidatus Poribacteria bacterium]|nr:YlxR family protein [Candidatus Poribacteria bacterium]MYK19731.1 YlxR family protein [Candidatus Poribacteria bacterium]